MHRPLISLLTNERENDTFKCKSLALNECLSKAFLLRCGFLFAAITSVDNNRSKDNRNQIWLFYSLFPKFGSFLLRENGEVALGDDYFDVAQNFCCF